MIWLFLGFVLVSMVTQVSLYWAWPSIGIVNLVSLSVMFYISGDAMKEAERKSQERECREQQD